MFESIFEQVGRAPIGVLLIIIGFLLLVLPAALRALAPAAAPSGRQALPAVFLFCRRDCYRTCMTATYARM